MVHSVVYEAIPDNTLSCSFVVSRVYSTRDRSFQRGIFSVKYLQSCSDNQVNKKPGDNTR